MVIRADKGQPLYNGKTAGSKRVLFSEVPLYLVSFIWTPWDQGVSVTKKMFQYNNLEFFLALQNFVHDFFFLFLFSILLIT